jgi:uncharacterized cupin superfamily protein
MCLVLLSVAVAVATLHYTEKVWATPAQGFVGTTRAVGRFAMVDAFPALVNEEEHKTKSPSPMQKTKGISDVYVESNVWQPGGSTGWHTHPGQSLIMVTEGAVTGYESNDPDCKAHVYAQGMGFVDPGGDHVHILRNEGTVVAKTIAVQLIPAAAVRRIDVADPGNCHF